MERALLLGSGGWIPTSARATCCALLRRDDHALVIDAGTGISRLLEAPHLLEGVERMDVLLTHFHLDHVVGLAYLPALPLKLPPTLYGPGEWLYGTSTSSVLERLVRRPLFALGLDALVSGVEELRKEPLIAGPFEVAARVQQEHNDPTLAFRVDDLLTYCTDTSYDEGNVELARGSSVLAHEAWYSEWAPREQATHSSAQEAARVAHAANVERLVMIHVRPGADEPALEEEARAVFPPSEVGSDLLPLAG
jgi:ribonuclease BN (tRNA processing enzyme)